MTKEEKATRPSSYKSGFEDSEFLLSDDMRPFRLALEFSKVDIALTRQRIASTVVVNGSTHILSPEQIRAAGKSSNLTEQQKRLSVWYQEARNFGRIVSERGGALAAEGMRHNVIATGGGPGIMEAANRGAADAGAPSIGFNIALPVEQEPNRYSTPELTFCFRYFGIRKMHFAMRANALAIFPGGFGTLDELFEILTLKQARKCALMPVILFSRAYWKKTINFDALVDLGMIDPDEIALFDIVDTAEEAWSIMVERGLTAATPLREA